MAVTATGNNPNQNALDLKDRHANDQQGQFFSGMLGQVADAFQPRQNVVLTEGKSEQNPFDSFSGPLTHHPMERGQMGPQNEGGHCPLGAEGGSGRGEQLREKAEDLRAQAEDLRSQADAVEADNPQLAQRLRDRADMLDQRAIALDQRADSVDERADIAMERKSIAAEGEALNAGDDALNFMPSGEIDHSVVGYPAGREANAVANAGWVDEAELEIYAAALSDIPELPDLEISASREANEAEVDVFLDVAEANGATTEDLELIEGFVAMFPIQFVFVDNLIEDYGVETASGGAVTVEETTTILIDTYFKDNNFTKVGKYESQEENDANLDVVEFSYASVLEIFDLPGAPADAGVVATEPFVSTAYTTVPAVDASVKYQGTILDENDEADAEATAAVSGAGDFDADE